MESNTDIKVPIFSFTKFCILVMLNSCKGGFSRLSLRLSHTE